MSAAPDSPSLVISQLTAPGRGAVATIAMHGNLRSLDQYFRAVNGKPANEQPLDRICYGQWGTEAAEDVVFIRIAVNLGELHCHGGTAAVSRILADLRDVGGVTVSADEWMRREHAGLAGELIAVVPKATTTRTARLIWAQIDLLPDAIQRLTAADWPQRREQLKGMLSWRDFGLHLTTPWRVVLCGRPNVGKSSLINALVGFERSVVYDQPGTTRDIVTVETAFDGWPVELSDTAGLRVTDDALESEGVRRARERLKNADAIVVVVDGTTGVTDEDRRVLEEFPDALAIWNKCDVSRPPVAIENPEEISLLPVSARTGEGLDQLMSSLVDTLVPETPGDEQAFPVSSRLVVTLERLHEAAIGEHAGDWQELMQSLVGDTTP